jgi:TPR repeat protein
MYGNATQKIRSTGAHNKKKFGVIAVVFGASLLAAIPHAATAGFIEGRQALKEENYAIAWQEFQPLAEAGVAAAQCRIAEMLRDGRGVERNLEAAAEWFQKAAEQGMARAQYALAHMYHRGRGVDQSEEESQRLFSAAFSDVLVEAEAGKVGQQLALAQMYRYGLGVTQDLERAGYWYREASVMLAASANAGDPLAAVKLARIYQTGIGVPKDFRKAIDLYRVAAEGSDSGAQFALGKILFNGIGDIERQPEAAIPYLELAARSGHPRAQVLLGLAHARGKGTKKDHVTAYAWLHLAREQGIPNAPVLIAEIEDDMSVDQITRARKQADRWRESAVSDQGNLAADTLRPIVRL